MKIQLWKKLGLNLIIATFLFGGLIVILLLLNKTHFFSKDLLNFSNLAFCIGIAASTTGVGYTLTIKDPNNFTGFYLGIVMSILLSIQFYIKGFYNLTILYTFIFIPFQIASIVSWKKQKDILLINPQYLSLTYKCLTFLVFLLLIFSDYLLSTYIINKDNIWENSIEKIINGIVISSSIIANFWLIFRKTDAWYYWLVYSIIGIIQGIVVLKNPFNTILFLFFVIINSIALYNWIKNHKNA
jgi:nicotinamide riboside transporter PnuC